MPHEKVTPQHWMLLDKETRDYLAKKFDIKVSGVTEVVDQRVVTDGRTMIDLEALSREAMCAFVGSDETFARAFELTIAKAYSELHPPVGTIMGKEQQNSAVLSVEPVVVAPKKRGRPAKIA